MCEQIANCCKKGMFRKTDSIENFTFVIIGNEANFSEPTSETADVHCTSSRKKQSKLKKKTAETIRVTDRIFQF